eukprot:TRINITY_DN2069_c0_g5_i1.p1 TRINITY_DN2069_c0_g5~~TRINITY_DN2069_c0_g5_i1.p1  ORF type:complete len:157 (+),score=39.26 TRINITY_DN2069_c0_g5_i1:90-560(+)
MPGSSHDAAPLYCIGACGAAAGVLTWCLLLKAEADQQKLVAELQDRLDATEALRREQEPLLLAARQEAATARREAGELQQRFDEAQRLHDEKLHRLENAQRRTRCCVCLVVECDVILLPCGHVCVCGDCAERLCDRPDAQCPLCREAISVLHKAYL